MRLTAYLLAAGLAGQAQTRPPQNPLKVGDLAPDFSLPSTTGQQIKLSDYRGQKSVILAFFPAAFTGG